MLRGRRPIFFLVLFFIGLSTKSQQYQPVIGKIDYKSPVHILKFADYLHQTADYNRSVIEYQRYLSATGSTGLITCGFKLADSYRQLGKLEKAINNYEIIQQTATIASENWWLAQSEIGQTYFLFGDYLRSITAFNKIANSPNKYRAKGKIWLGINQIFLGQFDLAQEYFSFTTVNPNPSDEILDYYQSMVEEGKKLPTKSPFVAGILSALLPGAGRIYLGRLGDFFNTLPTITLIGLLSYSGFRHQKERSIKGWSFSVVGSMFYLSNIYGSWLGAKIHNRQISEDFLRKIVIPLSNY